LTHIYPPSPGITRGDQQTFGEHGGFLRVAVAVRVLEDEDLVVGGLAGWIGIDS